ncbi:MAG: glycosyltransferase family 1 protein, partial [Sediminibacterium sp.]|nr:glycosyltransferase family 1 protein [Sediminibacterium sp.]
FTLTHSIETYSLVQYYLSNLGIIPNKLITPQKRFIGWYNPYHFGNKQLRKFYQFFGINNHGSIPIKYQQTADIFYSPYYPIPAYLQSIKKCITIYDLIPVLPQYAHFINKDFQHVVPEIKSILNSANQCNISTISEFTKQDLLTWNPNINPALVIPIHLGIDQLKFVPQHHQTDWLKVQTKYNLPNKYLLTLGTVEPRKNGLHIIKAFQQCIHDYKINDLYLVIAGNITVEYKKTLNAQLELKNKVIFIGRIDDADISILYSRANSFYFMSFAEGFGFPPLEAMACGVPVVTSNTTSLPEIIEDAGIMLDPNDEHILSQTMYQLYSSQDLCQKYIQLGLNHVKKFTWQKTANEYYNLFKKIVDEL